MTLSRDHWKGQTCWKNLNTVETNETVDFGRHAHPVDRASVVVKKRGNARGAKGCRKGRSVSDKNSEKQSSAVPSGAKQDEEIYGHWPWVERSVWSERMLQALEDGVKGGKWFSLKKDNLKRWPNAYFEKHGLFSLEKARCLAVQSH